LTQAWLELHAKFSSRISPEKEKEEQGKGGNSTVGIPLETGRLRTRV